MSIGTRLGTIALLTLLAGCAESGDYDDDDGWSSSDGSTAAPSVPQFSDGRSYHAVTACPPPGNYQSSSDYSAPPAGMSAEAWRKILGEIDQDQKEIDTACRDGQLYATDYAPNVMKYGILKK